MFRYSLAVMLLIAPVALPAQEQTGSSNAQAETGKPPLRIRNVQLSQGEACPPSTGDEIVVCGTLEEPYRIPKDLRESKKNEAVNQSWVNRAATIDEVGRVAGGIPNTCSPVGTGGQTGCLSKFLSDAAAEKRQKKADAESVP